MLFRSTCKLLTECGWKMSTPCLDLCEPWVHIAWAQFKWFQYDLSSWQSYETDISLSINSGKGICAIGAITCHIRTSVRWMFQHISVLQSGHRIYEWMGRINVNPSMLILALFPLLLCLQFQRNKDAVKGLLQLNRVVPALVCRTNKFPSVCIIRPLEPWRYSYSELTEWDSEQIPRVKQM